MFFQKSFAAENIPAFRRIEPIGIVVYNKAHHMIAWCHLRNGYRDFKVKAIRVIANTEVPFQKKGLLTLKEYMQQFNKRERLRA